MVSETTAVCIQNPDDELGAQQRKFTHHQVSKVRPYRDLSSYVWKICPGVKIHHSPDGIRAITDHLEPKGVANFAVGTITTLFGKHCPRSKL